MRTGTQQLRMGKAPFSRDKVCSSSHAPPASEQGSGISAHGSPSPCLIQDQPVLPLVGVPAVQACILVLTPFPWTIRDPPALCWLPLVLFSAFWSRTPCQRDLGVAKATGETWQAGKLLQTL